MEKLYEMLSDPEIQVLLKKSRYPKKFRELFYCNTAKGITRIFGEKKNIPPEEVYPILFVAKTDEEGNVLCDYNADPICQAVKIPNLYYIVLQHRPRKSEIYLEK